MKNLVNQVHKSLVMMYRRLSFSRNIIITIRLSIARARSLFKPISMLAFRKNIKVLIRSMIGCLRLIVKVLFLNKFFIIKNNLSVLNN